MRPFKKYLSIVGATVAASVLGASIASAQTLAVNPTSVTGPESGGPTTPGSVTLVFTNGGANPTGFQADLAFDDTVLVLTPAANNPPDHFTTCVLVGTNIVRLASAHTLGSPVASGTFCTIQISVIAGSAEGPYPLTLQDTVNVDGGVTNGVVNVVGLVAPSVVVNPNGGPQTLTGGSAIGATNSFAFSASSTASPGDAGGANATITCGPAPAGFTIAPAGVQTFIAGTANTVNYTSTCVRGAAAQTGDLPCAVNDQGGGRDVVFNLTCSEGVPIPGPTLAFDPNGGAFPLPGGIIGGTASRPINVNVTATGGAGGPSSTATCSTAAPFTVTGSPVTVASPGTVGTAGTISVSCTRTDAEQNGTVTCDIDGGAPVTFAAVCPAGSTFVLPDAQPVPTVSNWGLYTLILLTLGLGVGFAYRRLN